MGMGEMGMTRLMGQVGRLRERFLSPLLSYLFHRVHATVVRHLGLHSVNLLGALWWGGGARERESVRERREREHARARTRHLHFARPAPRSPTCRNGRIALRCSSVVSAAMVVEGL